jgi:hypothetical protein
MKIDKKKTVLLSMLFLIMSLIVLVIIGVSSESTEEIENPINLPNNIAVLQDGSFISLSHYYDIGYWKGVSDVLEYLEKNNNLRKDTSTHIHLEYFIDKCNLNSELYFEELKNK